MRIPLPPYRLTPIGWVLTAPLVGAIVVYALAPNWAELPAFVVPAFTLLVIAQSVRKGPRSS